MSKPIQPLRTEEWPLDRFQPDPKEVARHDDPEKVRLLGQDMLANGQLQAVGATEDGRLIFGHGRFLAARYAGIKALEVKVYPASLTETQFRLIRLAENIHRQDLTAYQKWLACTELLCGNATWKLQDLAEHLHLDPSSVTRLMSPSKLSEEWQNALRDGRVGISDCYAASKAPPDQHAALLAAKLNGATRDQLEQTARKQRNRTPTVKLSRCRLPLSTGVTVTVQGPEMSLEQLIENLQTALDAARKANRESLDIKTAEKVWKDKAKVVA